MGQELECTLRYRGRTVAGKALLETDHVLFRGDERLKVRFQDLTGVHAGEGVLRLEFEGGPAELELGQTAEKWAGKILHPPSLMQKLGAKPGAAARLTGEFDDDFRRELQRAGVQLEAGRSKPGLLFLAANAAADLSKIGKLASGMKPDAALWVVYPKGVTAVREIEVLSAGRAAGLKDVKVAGFSATHTALKFVVPVERR